MRFRQGTAPAVLYRNGKKAWEFYGGLLETDDAELAALLVERGAVAETPDEARNITPSPPPKVGGFSEGMETPVSMPDGKRRVEERGSEVATGEGGPPPPTPPPAGAEGGENREGEPAPRARKRAKVAP